MANFHSATLWFILSYIAQLAEATSKPKFRQWYQQAGSIFNVTLHKYCTSEYNYYLTHDCSVGDESCVYQAVGCIIDNSTGFDVTKMAASGVLLGILPSALALIGSSTVETGMLTLRRPLLAFLLGAGSPAVNPMQAFDYRSPSESLRIRQGALEIPRLDKRYRVFISCTQYVLAIGAVLNLAVVSWQLGRWTISSWSPETTFTPALWAFLAAPIHVAGSVVTWLRLRFISSDKRTDHAEVRRGKFATVIKLIRDHEFQPTCFQQPATIVLRKESYAFLLLSWLTSTCTVFHIIFGTLMFSGTLFINPKDAIGVIGQYFASTLVCRTVLAFEIAGMRQTIDVDENMPADPEQVELLSISK